MDHQNRLNRILSKPGNKVCADCNGRNPRWASISLGVFVCIRCCGLHRALGTHISKMKSTTLDRWTPQMFAIFEAVDNEVANQYWEAKRPKNQSRPNESTGAHAVEIFLRDKYERKIWTGTGDDPVKASMQPRIAKKEQEKKEERRNLSNGLINTDLLMDGPLINVNSKRGEESLQNEIPGYGHKQAWNQTTPAILDGAKGNPFFRNTPPVFPLFPESRSFEQGAPSSTVGDCAAQNVPQFVAADYSNSTEFSRSSQSAQPINFYNQNNSILFNAAEAEKNKKISQVLSMYAPQPAQPTIPSNQNGGFKPLGAIAAQNFFNQSSRSQPYPTF